MTAFRDKLPSLFNKLTSVQTLSPYRQETFTACAAPFPCFPPSRPLTQKTNSAHSSFCASPQPEFTKGHTLQILSQNYHDTGTVCDFKHISHETHLVHCRIDPCHDRSADDTAADPLNDALSDESSSVPGPVLKKAVASSGNGSLHCRVSPYSTSKRRTVPFLARPVSADAPDAKKSKPFGELHSIPDCLAEHTHSLPWASNMIAHQCPMVKFWRFPLDAPPCVSRIQLNTCATSIAHLCDHILFKSRKPDSQRKIRRSVTLFGIIARI